VKRWGPRTVAAVRRRIDRYGLRVLCAACDWESRHFPQSGRIRDARCPRCGATELHAKAWAEKYATAFALACDRAKAIARAQHGRV